MEGTVDSSREIICLPDLDAEFIFDRSLFIVKQLKELKVPSRERDYDLICTACGRGFKTLNSTQNHVDAKSHIVNKREKQLEEILPSLVTPPEGYFFQLTQFVEHIYLEHSAVMKGQASLRRDVVTQLEGLVQQQFPDATAGLHGSSVSGFALVTSNININLTIPAIQNMIPSIMKATLSILRSSDDLYAEVKEDFFAFNKIPRILFCDKKSGLNCEVRANAGNPMVLAPLLQLYSSIDDRVKKLGVMFRYWSSVCGVDMQENGHYPSHMFVIMTIHYLQQRIPPVLPVLQERYPDLLPPCETASWDALELITLERITKVCEALQSWQVLNHESLGELWHGLLKYYTVEFDSPRVAVSICQSKPLIRESRQWGTARLAVEDPLIPRSNLARAAASDKVFTYLMSSLKQSYAYFNAGNYEVAAHAKVQPVVNDVSESKLVEGNVEFEDSAILFAAFGTADISTTEATDFIFQSISTCVIDSQSGSASAVDSATPTPKTPVKSRESSCRGSIARDVYSICFGSFREGEDISTYAKFTKTDLDAQCEFFSGDQTVLKEKEVKKPLIKCEDGDGLTALRYDPKVAFGMQCKHLVFQDYPTACLNCRRRGHIAIKCPEEDLHAISISLPKVPPSEQSLKSMAVVLKEYVKSVCPKHEDLMHRQSICDQILRDILIVYPGAKLELFGSSANGFGMWNSDLDLCLTLPAYDQDDSEVDKDFQTDVIQTVAKLLGEHRMYDNIIPITSARVPIVKFRLPRYQLLGDISLENRLALRNTKMMFAYAKIDNRVKLLGYVVKHFAKVCDIGDASSGSLSSYAYILLVIHYLQRTTPPVIPVLQKLYRSEKRISHQTLGPVINMWNCYYFEFNSVSEVVKHWTGHGKNKENVAKLWLGFLRYYITFDWASEVVTVRDLEPLKKVDKWWMNKHMCIEDPFNLDHNLASAVSGKMRMYILERFCAALFYNSQRVYWKSIGQLLDKRILVGDTRVPKFLICNVCNQRGHKASSCPKANSRASTRKKVIAHPPAVHRISKSAGVPYSAVPVRHSLPLHETSIPTEYSHPMYGSANLQEMGVSQHLPVSLSAIPRAVAPPTHYSSTSPLQPAITFTQGDPAYYYQHNQFQPQNPTGREPSVYVEPLASVYAPFSTAVHPRQLQ